MGGELAKSSKPREGRQYEMKPFAAATLRRRRRSRWPFERGVSKRKRCILHITAVQGVEGLLGSDITVFQFSVFLFDTLHDVTKNLF